MTQRKVTVERGWDHGQNRWAVLEWNWDGTESWVISGHSGREAALNAAFEYAYDRGLYFRTAEVVPLRPAKETLF